MRLPQRLQFLHIAAGAFALPAVSYAAWRRSRQLSILSVVVSMFPICVEAATHTVNCDAGEKIQQKLAAVKPGDEIKVHGTCSEGVRIEAEVMRLVLDGEGAIVRSGRFGVHLDVGSSAQIANNRIEDVGLDGIDVTEHSVARIGFLLPVLPQTGPNIIKNSGRDGISISRGSSAWIIGNSITGNKGSGINISRNAQADILANSINGNGGDAITAAYSSGINFSSEGTPRREGPNKTDSQERNAGVGVRCMIGGHVAGPLGTLSGIKGAKEFDNTCIDKLLPN